MLKTTFPTTTLRHHFSKTFYMRKLPDKQIRLASQQGKSIFKQSLEEGNLQCYFPLAQQFTTQMEPSTCGPTSLVMVLNALGVDPRKEWKGIWRWYNEENLNMMTKEILRKGLHLESWTHIAKHNYLDVATFYYPDERVKRKAVGRGKDEVDCDLGCWDGESLKTASFGTFKDCVLSSVRREGFILTLNHSRKKMHQTGSGHYSPIGGYNAKRDLILMLDVARFKYPSYWCTTSDLFESLSQIDQDSQLPRGFVLVSRKLQSRSEICKVGMDYPAIKEYHKFLFSLKDNGNRLPFVVDQVLSGFNALFRSTLVYFLFEVETATKEQKQQLYSLIRQQPLYKEIEKQLIENETSELRNDNYRRLQLLVNEFTGGKFKQITYLIVRSLPKDVFNPNPPPPQPHHHTHHHHHIHHAQYTSQKQPSNPTLLDKYIATMRRCFGIFRQHHKSSEYF